MKKTLGLAAVMLLVFSLSLDLRAAPLRLAHAADQVSLDPYDELSNAGLQISHLIFDPLVRWNKANGFDPRLAVSWKRMDKFTVRFNLRKGVRFHSGNEFTARDLAWTFDRLKSSVDFKNHFQPFREFRVIDDHTIDLVTDKPYPLVLQRATLIFPMDSKYYTGTDKNGLAKDMLKKHAPTFASANASGTGPFTVTELNPDGSVGLKRFEAYWDTASPGNLDDIVVVPIADERARADALLAGAVDFLAPVPPAEVDRIRKNVKLHLATTGGTRVITLQLNQERRPEFRDKRVRKAIVYAVHNEGIVKKNMEGFGTAAAQHSPRGFAGHVPSLRPRHDLGQAQQLMREAGFEKGFAVTMMVPGDLYERGSEIAQAVTAMLSRINIKVDLQILPRAQYWQKFDEREADIMMIGWHSTTDDSANFAEFLALCPDRETGHGQYNSGNYCNREVDRLALSAQTETDDAKRGEMLRKIEQILHDEAAFVPLHWQNLVWAARRDVPIQDIINPMNLPYLGDLVIE